MLIILILIFFYYLYIYFLIVIFRFVEVKEGMYVFLKGDDWSNVRRNGVKIKVVNFIFMIINIRLCYCRNGYC